MTTSEPARGSAEYLRRAREGWRRLSAREAFEAQQRGEAIIIDTRTESQRAETAEIPGAIVIDRTVLEWRLDPTFEWRIPEVRSWDQTWVVVCRHGYSSSVAARCLQELGLVNATDVEGGYDAWVADGLPTTRQTADVRR